MKKIAFISDFDGTMTFNDFYKIIIEKYLGDWGQNFYNQWQKEGKKIGIEFLNIIFGKIGKSEEEIYNEIIQIPFDNSVIELINLINEKDGDFYILSAGTIYYIDKFLDYKGINNVKIISMEGAYENGGIKIIPDKNSPFYSEVFGLDKGKVVESLKSQYSLVFFAGDSEPDLGAAKNSNMVFAKKSLGEFLKKENISYMPFENFSEVNKFIRRFFDENSNS
jgi:2-hydroxy-3-keto-5-methylthiopentenyl-1-phosphate phosphatase